MARLSEVSLHLEHCNRLSREAVKALYLEIIKVRLSKALWATSSHGGCPCWLHRGQTGWSCWSLTTKPFSLLTDLNTVNQSVNHQMFKLCFFTDCLWLGYWSNEKWCVLGGTDSSCLINCSLNPPMQLSKSQIAFVHFLTYLFENKFRRQKDVSLFCSSLNSSGVLKI